MARKGFSKSTQRIPERLLGLKKHTAKVNSLRNGGDSGMEQNENDFKDPEDGFCDKTNSEGVVSNAEVHFFFFYL